MPDYDHSHHIKRQYEYNREGVNTTQLNYPDQFGPGLWFSIHITAKNSVTLAEKKQFITWITQIVESIKCTECRGHAVEYVKTHPLEPYFDLTEDETGLDIGMFKWTWTFHNTVNFRLQKPYCDWETAMSIFYDGDFKPCDENCGSAHSGTQAIIVAGQSRAENAKLAAPLYFRALGKQF